MDFCWKGATSSVAESRAALSQTTSGLKPSLQVLFEEEDGVYARVPIFS